MSYQDIHIGEEYTFQLASLRLVLIKVSPQIVPFGMRGAMIHPVSANKKRYGVTVQANSEEVLLQDFDGGENPGKEMTFPISTNQHGQFAKLEFALETGGKQLKVEYTVRILPPKLDPRESLKGQESVLAQVDAG